MKRVVLISFALLIAAAVTASAQTAPKQAPANPAQSAVGARFVDANGDGICDNFQSGNRMGQGARAGRGGYGPGDGTGNKGMGPKDGTGFGPGSGAGGGICDGTGPKGKAARRGQGR